MTRNRTNDDELFPWEVPDDSPSGYEAAGAAAPVLEPPPTARPASRSEPREARTAEDRSEPEPSRPTPGRDRPVLQREYYSISDVCDIVDLKPHVLRYWETQFGPLNPSKNRSGNRVYQRKEIRLILLVKHLLYEEKYTVDGARAKLDQMRRAGRLQEMTGRAMTTDTASFVRSELEQLLDVLSPAGQD